MPGPACKKARKIFATADDPNLARAVNQAISYAAAPRATPAMLAATKQSLELTVQTVFTELAKRHPNFEKGARAFVDITKRQGTNAADLGKTVTRFGKVLETPFRGLVEEMLQGVEFVKLRTKLKMSSLIPNSPYLGKKAASVIPEVVADIEKNYKGYGLTQERMEFLKSGFKALEAKYAGGGTLIDNLEVDAIASFPGHGVGDFVVDLTVKEVHWHYAKTFFYTWLLRKTTALNFFEVDWTRLLSKWLQENKELAEIAKNGLDPNLPLPKPH